MPIQYTQRDPNAFYKGAEFEQRNRLTELAAQNEQQDRQLAMQDRTRRIDRENVLAKRQDEKYEQELTDRERELVSKVYAPLAGEALKSGNPQQFLKGLWGNPQLARMLQRDGIIDPGDEDDPELPNHLQALSAFGAEQKPPQIGGVQPGDYEPGSIDAFRKSGNYGDLKPYTPPQAQGGRNAPSGYDFTPDGRALRAIPGGPADPNTKSTKDDSRVFAKADKLRDEFNAQSKDFVSVNDAYNVVKETAANPSAAGDLSLIFAYMKMLDPTSVVREQEFANAQNAAGIPDRVRNSYNKALKGERLNPQQRQDFITQAQNLYNTRKARNDSLKKRYTDIATRNNVDPLDVVGDMDVMMGGPAAGVAAQGQRLTPEQAAKLPSGTKFVGMDGVTRVKN